MPLETRRLLRVCKAQASDIARWREGVSLERDAGIDVATLSRSSAVARLQLAYLMRLTANSCMDHGRGQYRSAISRYYYAIYHALRAATYVFHDGDDHEAHSVLPTYLPTDFIDHLHWSNQLKSAREYRNRADYDPYPSGYTAWRSIATAVKEDADTLLPLVRTYLLGKGCRI